MVNYDSGIIYCTSGNSTHTEYGQVWNNPSNIISNDDSFSTVSLVTGAFSDVLIGLFSSSAFSNLPDNAIISGIIAYIGRKASVDGRLYTGYAFGDYFPGIQLKYNNGNLGTPKGNGVDYRWGTSEFQEIHGSNSDLWGATITPSIIKSGSFGLSLFCSNIVTGGTTIASVDYLALRIYATYIESGPAHLKTFNGTQASNIKTRNGVNQINIKTIHGV